MVCTDSTMGRSYKSTHAKRCPQAHADADRGKTSPQGHSDQSRHYTMTLKAHRKERQRQEVGSAGLQCHQHLQSQAWRSEACRDLRGEAARPHPAARHMQRARRQAGAGSAPDTVRCAEPGTVCTGPAERQSSTEQKHRWCVHPQV